MYSCFTCTGSTESIAGSADFFNSLTLYNQVVYPTEVRGMVVVKQELFVVCALSNEALVFNTISFLFQTKFLVEALVDPCCISANATALFIKEFMRNTVYRVSLAERWKTAKLELDDMILDASLSITWRGTILVPSITQHTGIWKICEYSSSGTSIREITLPKEIIGVKQVAELSDTLYVLTHANQTTGVHRICSVDSAGEEKTSVERNGCLPFDLIVERHTRTIVVCCRESNEITTLRANMEVLDINMAHGIISTKRCTRIYLKNVDEFIPMVCYFSDANNKKIISYEIDIIKYLEACDAKKLKIDHQLATNNNV